MPTIFSMRLTEETNLILVFSFKTLQHVRGSVNFSSQFTEIGILRPNTKLSSAKVSNSSPRHLAVVKNDFQHDLQANSAFVISDDNSDRNQITTW